MSKPEELQVYMSNRDTECTECCTPVEQEEFVTLKRPSNDPLCLSCSDLDHLVFLPSGDVALTRRARKHSPLSAPVFKFSKARKRNERQGVLVSAEGLARAEEECLSDEELRARNREKARVRETRKDAQYVKDFAAEILRFFPGCPEETATSVAVHACEKHSGRVGRSAGAKELGEDFVILAVRAHIRHAETDYDELLSRCYDRQMARERVHDQIEECVSRWREG